MYQQNCIQNHVGFLYDRLNWLFYAIIPIEVKIKLSSVHPSVRLCVRNFYISKSTTNQWHRQVW